MANSGGTMLTVILEWIWAPIVVAFVWLARRTYALEHKYKDDKSDTDRKLAVDQVEILNLKEKIEGLAQKNTSEHADIKGDVQSLSGLVHDHHKTVIELLTAIKNGKK
jgi:hypothetical protein